MDGGKITEDTPASADPSKDLRDFQDLAIDDSTDEKPAPKGKKRKNHRGGQKKKQKNGQESIGAAAESSKANDGAKRNDPEQMYEVKETKNKGFGVFATRDILRGTRIMCEAPLLYVERHKAPYIPAYFCKLPPKSQKKLIPSRTPCVKSSIGDQLKLMAIVKSNNCKKDFTVAVCYNIGRVNHSCLPNVYHTWNDIIGRATAHAVQDIAAGQEILTTYTKGYQPRAERQSLLSGRWGFQCDCEACNSSSAFGKASEKRRKRLFKINHAVALHDQLLTTGPFGSAAEALVAVIESAKLLQEEGIHNMELRVAYENAANINVNMSNLEAACEWQEKALEVAAACAGTDNVIYHEGQETLARMRQLMSQRKARR
ncbi:MAG: hypothetical protein Q9209_004180 [Squamulea sp. 1 TL-2023]